MPGTSGGGEILQAGHHHRPPVSGDQLQVSDVSGVMDISGISDVNGVSDVLPPNELIFRPIVLTSKTHLTVHCYQGYLQRMSELFLVENWHFR